MLMSRRRVRVQGVSLPLGAGTYPFHFRHTLVFFFPYHPFFMQMSFFVYLAGIVFAAILSLIFLQLLDRKRERAREI